jgi:hypothetical protein
MIESEKMKDEEMAGTSGSLHQPELDTYSAHGQGREQQAKGKNEKNETLVVNYIKC